MGADRKVNTLGRGALQRSHNAALEPFAQLGDACCSVGAAPLGVEAAELVASQTAKGRGGVSMGVDSRLTAEGRTLASWFKRRAAYSSECSVELPLRPSARAAPPSRPSLLFLRQRGRKQRWELSSVNGR